VLHHRITAAQKPRLTATTSPANFAFKKFFSYSHIMSLSLSFYLALEDTEHLSYKLWQLQSYCVWP